MRDIIVYKCDVCDREVQLQRKPKTIETAGRCIITDKCRGKLYVERLIKTTSPFIKRTEEVVGLDNFYQRNKLFKFTQLYEKSTWSIEHNLESFPIISVYDVDKNVIPDSDFQVTIIDKNKITLKFNTFVSGTAELYVREVSKTTTVVAVSDELETTPVSSDAALGTMAVLTRSAAAIGTSVSLKTTSSNGQIQFSSATIASSSGSSPWSGYSKVVIRNITYYIGFIDFFSNGFNASLISNGTIIEVDQDNASNTAVTHFLLADDPFDRADIIRDQVLEVSKINATTSSLFFDNDEVFCNNKYITKLYPKLITI